eukprot:TRINITY_DN5277_c0_g1_i6.p1 TRINITY_DN5277_c0_g1~~TRINITY_DN5277_c0_g1_i6.p1  ORF type:complete len:154 (-),score=14.99 TRINITY_DN5277_c0_g1_i6:117-578(-)
MKAIILAVVFLGSILLALGAEECTYASECGPARCCHANRAVPLAQAPNCDGVACALYCRPGLDLTCGSHIGCYKSECIVSNNNKYCTDASDCVPRQCCHATEAVNKAFGLDCSKEAGCTAVCEPGTLDCGNAFITCIDNECTVLPQGASAPAK